MTDEQRIKRIEAYLDKALSEQERQDFEKDMTANEDLRKQVLLQESIRLAFKNLSDTSLQAQMDDLFEQNRYRFEKKIDTADIDTDFWKDIDAEPKQAATDTPPSVSAASEPPILKPLVSKNRWLGFAIAASFALLLGIGWWWWAQKNLAADKGSILTNTEGGPSQPSTKDKTPIETPDKPTDKPLDSKSVSEPIANTDKQASDMIQKITTLVAVEKNMAATVMSSVANKDLYEIAVKNYVSTGDTKGFEAYLKSEVKADSYQNIKRLVHAHFRLKNYEKAISYGLEGQKLTDLEPDEAQELRLLLLESYYGNVTKYKAVIKNISETGSAEEKNLIKTMVSFSH